MSEWLKEHAWKACVGETLPWVRIPLSPPHPSLRSVCVGMAVLRQPAQADGLSEVARVPSAHLSRGARESDPAQSSTAKRAQTDAVQPVSLITGMTSVRGRSFLRLVCRLQLHVVAATPSIAAQARPEDKVLSLDDPRRVGGVEVVGLCSSSTFVAAGPFIVKAIRILIRAPTLSFVH